jgi:polyhydroxyalkanoate synthesis repressor PhaR
LITIKKYPNRRLYDTSTSQYVNLDYVRQLVLNHTEFEIVSSKDGSSLTKTVLLQIISEAETNDQQSLLTDVLLKQLIRFYDGEMQVFVRQYLEQSMTKFLDQQETMQSMMKNLVDSSPINMFGKMMEQNMDMWTGKKDKNNKEN